MSEDKVCNRKHDYGEQQAPKQKVVSDAELDAIIDRLYTQQMKKIKENENEEKEERKQGKTEAEVDNIVERLYKTKTKAMENDPSKGPAAEDKISKKKVPSSELDSIIDRLYTTHTESSSADNKPKKQNTDIISKKGLSEEEIQEIYNRLVTTHTKTSAGGAQCKSMDPLKEPGLGLKMLPIIEGLEERFKGKTLTDEQAGEIMERLRKAETSASQARKDFPRILLYPERTILHNCTSRIRDYQESGAMSRQKELERREKWYN